MKNKTTLEAFRELIATPGIHEAIGVSASRIRSMQTALRKMDEGSITSKEKISNDKMEELLERAGWKVVQEKLWNKPGFTPGAHTSSKDTDVSEKEYLSPNWMKDNKLSIKTG